MQHLYGTFSNEQIKEFKVKLHKECFWLLLYKDPETEYKYKHVDYDKYFTGVMKKLNGFNELVNYPVEIVSIMSLLQAAMQETKKAEFNYHVYRKLILDAHNLIDKIDC